MDWLTLALLGALFVYALILFAEAVNGWTDAPNAIVTVVSTGVLPPRVAIVLAVVFNIVGAASGLAVAKTISGGFVEPSVITLPAIGAAMVSVIAWGSFAGITGLPVSKSHALVAAITGAGLACGGPDALIGWGWWLVLIGLAFSSGIGCVLGFAIGKFVTRVAIMLTNLGVRPSRQKWIFDHLQMCSATAMAWAHGLNDGQKFIGIFAFTLVMQGHADKASIPWWVIVVCALTMGAGTALGGWEIMRTVGMRMVRLNSLQGFAAELTASTIIFAVSQFGVPLSTTHTINTSIVGVAASKSVRNVRWDVLGRIVLGWVCTFPICGTIAFIAALIVNRVLQ
ncbi:MAG: inorganic phosphate transporter [bacterium]|nr:inorganic phosphate transporter [bacterium]